MKNKTCSKCHIEKEINEFNWKVKSKRIRQSACKECSRAEGRAHYKVNAKDVIQKNVARSKSYWNLTQAWKNTLHCVVCGEDYFRCLEFHHLNKEEKEFPISTKTRNNAPQFILKEAKKCIVLCANCHRKVHGEILTLKQHHFLENEQMIEQTSKTLVHPLASNQWKG